MNVPDKAIEIKALLAAVLAFFTALWGWVGWAVMIFIFCMFLDFLTGSWAARARGEWSSAVAREGLWHKLGEIVALLVAALCDIAIQVLLQTAAAPILDNVSQRCYITLIVSAWYIFTELGSITENAGKLGAPIPKWLAKGIAVLKAKADDAKPIPDAAEIHDKPPDE